MKFLAVVILAGLLVWPVVAHADPQDEGVRRVGLQLQCPVCEGQTVADSPSGLAGDMRAVIRAKLSAGESDQRILDDFVASYGDGILTEPPKRGISLGVWIGPVVAVAVGGALVTALLRMWRRRSPAGMGTVGVDSEVVDEFRRFRQEYGQ